MKTVAYFKSLSADVRVHMRCSHTACLVRFIANGALEWSLISTEIEIYAIKSSFSIKK